MSAPRLLVAGLVPFFLGFAACDDGDGGDGGSADAGPSFDAAAPDGALTACGIEEPGTRCKDSRTLERCAGDQVEEVPCGDDLCGPDPAAAGGAACIAPGAACGVIDYYGACEGGTLAWCSEEAGLVVSDCADVYGVCAYVSPSVGFNCTTPCLLMDVTAEGRCSGSGIERCVFADGQYGIVTDACPAGQTCDSSLPETGQPGCAPTGACASVGPAGRCSGDTLTSCSGGAPATIDCAATGEVCTWGGAGYTCAPAGAMGASTVSGTVTYEDRPPQIDGSLGAPTARPARGVAVALVDDTTGEVLAASVTADDGSYTLSHDAPAGTMVHVLVAATSSQPGRHIRVLRPDGLVHGFGGASFAAAATSVADVAVTDISGLSPAFNVFDQTIDAFDALGGDFGATSLPPIYLVWTRGGDDGTYFSGGIFLLGGVSDDDGYDDTVILHEIGHWLEDRLGRSDSPGGAHDGSPTDPRLAWSEGFATYFAMAVRGQPYYMDSNVYGGWSQDADTEVTLAPDPGGNMMQLIGEGLVTEVLWDVGDSVGGPPGMPAPDDDGHAGTHAQVMAVELDYLPGNQFADRGRVGVDLVDWLDGWFLQQGLGSCAALRAIVSGTHKFPYDFAGAAGACP